MTVPDLGNVFVFVLLTFVLVLAFAIWQATIDKKVEKQIKELRKLYKSVNHPSDAK